MRNVSMARMTTWGTGGPADHVYAPADVDDLADFFAGSGPVPGPGDPILWVGLGSNLLVRDGGVGGVVILTARRLGRIEESGECLVRAGAGVPCAKLARYLGAKGYAGGEFLAGVPGTIGGALAMNAGAHGAETWDLVQCVETIDRNGRRRRRARREFEIGYRSVEGRPGEWFTCAELRFVPADPAAVKARIRRMIRARAASQPVGQRSCGSVFRNPPGDHAGRLVEACGLKGTRIGGAVVSEKHGNFIVNEGAASSSDVETLIGKVRTRVFDETGVDLEPEVRVVGRRPPSRDGRPKPEGRP